MSINIYSDIGPVIKCKPNGKDRLWDIPDEKLYFISDESEANCFRDNHVYASNRHGYSINTIKEIGQLRKLCDCNESLLNRFKTDFKDEIKFIVDYYGEENTEIFIALYSYYS